jgi:hypothetical protein
MQRATAAAAQLVARRAAACSSSSCAASSAASTSFASPRRGFHATAAAARGSKNLDWYFNALRRIEREKSRPEVPVFPAETLHGRKRARVFVDVAFGAPATPEGAAAAAASGAAAPAAQPPAAAAAAAAASGPTQRIVLELADDIVPMTVENFVQVRKERGGA